MAQRTLQWSIMRNRWSAVVTFTPLLPGVGWRQPGAASSSLSLVRLGFLRRKGSQWSFTSDHHQHNDSLSLLALALALFFCKSSIFFCSFLVVSHPSVWMESVIIIVHFKLGCCIFISCHDKQILWQPTKTGKFHWKCFFFCNSQSEMVPGRKVKILFSDKKVGILSVITSSAVTSAFELPAP